MEASINQLSNYLYLATKTEFKENFSKLSPEKASAYVVEFYKEIKTARKKNFWVYNPNAISLPHFKDRHKYVDFLNFVSELYPEIKKNFTGQSLNTDGICFIIEKLKVRGKLNGLEFAPSESFDSFYHQIRTKLLQTRDIDSCRCFYIVRCRKNFSSDYHVTPIYFEKNPDGLSFFISDSLGNRQKWLDDHMSMIKKALSEVPQDKLVKVYYYYGEPRQTNDFVSCPIFALLDGIQFSQNTDLMDVIKSNANPFITLDNVQQLQVRCLPPQFANISQTLSFLSPYWLTKTLVSRKTGQEESVEERINRHVSFFRQDEYGNPKKINFKIEEKRLNFERQIVLHYLSEKGIK